MFDPKVFKPHFTQRNPHLQTLISYSRSKTVPSNSTIQFVALDDGDSLAHVISHPVSTPRGVILLLPGTAGSDRSPYMQRIAKGFNDLNYISVRANYRGLGPAIGRAKKISHGGSSDDVLAMITHTKNNYPNLALYVIGFSLGANILLKLAAEENLSILTTKCFAVCPPLNLAKSSKKLERFQNRLYQKSIVSSIAAIVHSSKSQFSYKPKVSLKKCKTLRDIDYYFTAPACGFKSPEDYYQRCSSIGLLDQIRSPCQILLAKDDPLIDYSEVASKKLPSNISLQITKHGGHMGFYQKNLKHPYWLDHWLSHYVRLN